MVHELKKQENPNHIAVHESMLEKGRCVYMESSYFLETPPRQEGLSRVGTASSPDHSALRLPVFWFPTARFGLALSSRA